MKLKILILGLLFSITSFSQIELLKGMMGDNKPNGIPSELIITATADDSISLAWNDISTNEDRYVVYRSEDGITYTTIDTIAANSESYINIGLTPYTTYYYRIRGLRGTLYTAYSNIVSAKTLYPFELRSSTVGWYVTDESSYVTLSGINVTSWHDISGNNNHLLQSDTSKAPHYTSDGLFFDGVNDFLRKEISGLAQPIYLYLVIDQITYTDNDRLLAGWQTDVGRIMQSIPNPVITAWAGTQSKANYNMTLNRYHVLRCLFNGVNSVLQVGNSDVVTGDFGANPLGGLTLGSRGSLTDGYSNIKVKELIIRNVADNGAISNTIYQYLANKDSVVDESFTNGKLLITFDDAINNLYNIALPVVVEKGVTFTAYISPGLIGDSEGRLSWSQVDSLKKYNIDIQDHSFSHVNYTTVTQAQIIEQINKVDSAFVAHGLTSPKHLAYPFGGYNTNVVSYVATYRFTARTVDDNFNIFKTTQQKLTLPSIVLDNITEEELQTIKSRILTAYNNKTALILYSHGVTESGGDYSVSTARFIEIIDYAKSIGVDIITISELYDLME